MPPCAALCRRIGSPIRNISGGLEEVADRWEEGIGRTQDIEDFLEGQDLRTSHTHKLQELGGCCTLMLHFASLSFSFPSMLWRSHVHFISIVYSSAIFCFHFVFVLDSLARFCVYGFCTGLLGWILSSFRLDLVFGQILSSTVFILYLFSLRFTLVSYLISLCCFHALFISKVLSCSAKFCFVVVLLSKSATNSGSAAVCVIRSVSLRQCVSFARSLPNSQEYTDIRNSMLKTQFFNNKLDYMIWEPSSTIHLNIIQTTPSLSCFNTSICAPWPDVVLCVSTIMVWTGSPDQGHG